MTVSRSAKEFMRRHGMVNTPRAPSPIFDADAMLVHTIPLNRQQLEANLMVDVLGAPPPDRGVTDVWPPPQEVIDNGTTSESQ